MHEISVEAKKDTLPFKTGTVNDGTPSDNVSSIYTLLEKLQNVNKQFSKNTVLDVEYENGTEQEKEKIIQNLAMEWGAYSLDGKTPLKLYHGTETFGFTEFDLNKMDDKRSIFLTDDINTAQTYSGIYDVKKISESKLSSYNKFSKKEIADALAKYNNETTQYKYYTKDNVNQMIDEINRKVEKLVKSVYSSYKEKQNYFASYYNLDEAFKQPDLSNEQTRHFIFWELDNLLMSQSPDVKNLANEINSYKLNLVAEYYMYPLVAEEVEKENGIIVAVDNDGALRAEFLRKDNALKRLMRLSEVSLGNYSLYAKLNNPFVIDVKGKHWNEIYTALEPSEKVAGEYTTREVAEFAHKQGYDGVVFKNIIDNGGNGKTSSDVADNIVVVFDNKMVKSADTVTYDNDGKVIPPSERFTDKSDIRYSKDTNFDDFDVKRYNEVWISDKSEYAAVMSAIKMSDLNDTPHFEIRKINTNGKSYLYYYDVDDNPHIVSKKANENYRRVYNEINDTSDELLESIENDESRYRNSKRSYELSDRRRTATSNDKLVNREIQTENPDNGTGYTENDGDVDLRGENSRYSRNTRLNYDENFDDVNEAFEQALNVLQNVKGIDVSSRVVEEIGKAQKNIDKELDGYHAQKITRIVIEKLVYQIVYFLFVC